MSAERRAPIAAAARSGRRLGAGALLALAALAPVASADLTPPQLLSSTAREQADVAFSPALSADGRHVAFSGTLGGVKGIFRRDLATGAVDIVVGGDAYARPPAAATDAQLPSISADGRYVAFVTAAVLRPADDPGSGRSVYVRDMARSGDACPAGASEPCGFELASALDGGSRGLTYGDRAGASLAPRVALSADGRRVAFALASTSDLASGDGIPATPALQVVVRDLDSRRTTLVSSRRDPLSGAMTGEPVEHGAVYPTAAAFAPQSATVGAALSADGTTVAWLGSAIAEQVPTLADEPRPDAPTPYVEPLWRRIADGPAAPTRRIVGGGDPLAPGCPPDGTLAVPACQGPFPALDSFASRRQPDPIGWLNLAARADGVPQLSADGRAVVLIGDPTTATNVFLVDMRDGLTRRQALRQLTREVPLADPSANGSLAFVAQTGDVFDVAIAPNGRRVAFATARTRFPLSPPRLLGSAPARIGVTELYRIDLDAEAVERVSVAAGGGPSEQPSGNPDLLLGYGAFAPSFSADGRTLTFASTAANLVAGDANAAADVFAVADVVVPATPGGSAFSPPPAALSFRPEWRLTTRAVSLRDGRVRIDAVVPAAGTLKATARATARVTVAARRGGRGRRGRPARTRLVTRQVASGTRRSRRDGALALTLRLTARERARARTRRGLTATVALRFSGRGGSALRDTLAVRFRVVRTPARRPATRRGRR